MARWDVRLVPCSWVSLRCVSTSSGTGSDQYIVEGREVVVGTGRGGWGQGLGESGYYVAKGTDFTVRRLHEMCMC